MPQKPIKNPIHFRNVIFSWKIAYENIADKNGERLYIKQAVEGEISCSATYSEINGIKICKKITIKNNHASFGCTNLSRLKINQKSDKSVPAIIIRDAIKNMGGTMVTKILPIEKVDAKSAYKKKTKYIIHPFFYFLIYPCRNSS